MKILVLNGPNLSRLDLREQKHYGDFDYPELKKEVEAEHSHHYFDTERNKPVHAVSSPVWPFAASSPKTFGPHEQAPDEWTQVIRGEGT